MSELWVDTINVGIIIEKAFRVGSRISYDSTSDLPVATVRARDGKRRPYLPPSSFKGIVRTACQKALSITQNDTLKNAYIRIFGEEPTKENRNKEGKIRIFETDETIDILSNIGLKSIQNRNGIRIDEKIGSVAYQSLFEFDFVELENSLKLTYGIYPVLPITKDEAAILIAGLRLLKYDTIGGFGSRGFGIIRDVLIPKDFVEFAEDQLRGYFA